MNRGCRGKPAPRPVKTDEDVNGDLTHYWNCPKLFIPQSIHIWYNIYKYHKDFPGASMKGGENQNPRFLQAYFTYTSYMAEYEALKG